MTPRRKGSRRSGSLWFRAVAGAPRRRPSAVGSRRQRRGPRSAGSGAPSAGTRKKGARRAPCFAACPGGRAGSPRHRRRGGRPARRGGCHRRSLAAPGLGRVAGPAGRRPLHAHARALRVGGGRRGRRAAAAPRGVADGGGRAGARPWRPALRPSDRRRRVRRPVGAPGRPGEDHRPPRRRVASRGARRARRGADRVAHRRARRRQGPLAGLVRRGRGPGGGRGRRVRGRAGRRPRARTSGQPAEARGARRRARRDGRDRRGLLPVAEAPDDPAPLGARGRAPRRDLALEQHVGPRDRRRRHRGDRPRGASRAVLAVEEEPEGAARG